jgi:hypothetical protein
MLSKKQVWGGTSWLKRVAFDVSVVNPTAASYSGAGACRGNESFLNPNAGTRAAEQTKTAKYKPLCEQRGMDFVPIVFRSGQVRSGLLLGRSLGP